LPVRCGFACSTLAGSLFGCLACGVLGTPGGDSQYPAVRIPTQVAPSRPAASARAAPNPPPEAPDSGPAPSHRLLRPSAVAESADAGSAPPPQGYLPDPPALSERARWLYEVRYDAGLIRAGSPELECLQRPTASARRIGRFAFELWLGAELIERIRFDFPLLAAEVPRQGRRRPLHEEPSFAPGAHVSTRLQVPASARATRAHILDRATGETTPVAWPPRAEAPEKLCPPAPGAPTPSAP
jgi:hypothetical protein